MAAHVAACARGGVNGSKTEAGRVPMDGPSASTRVQLLFSFLSSSDGFEHTALFFIVFTYFLPLARFFSCVLTAYKYSSRTDITPSRIDRRELLGIAE